MLSFRRIRQWTETGKSRWDGEISLRHLADRDDKFLMFMRRKKVKVEKNNTRIAILFVIFVCLIILISFALKVAYVVGQSKFDGDSRFTISVSNNKNLRILSFSPDTNSISVLNLDGKVKKLNINRFLAIPIDGFVQADFLDIGKDVAALMSSVFLGFRNVKTDLTIVDISRLFLASKTTSSKNVVTLHISTSFESVKVDKIVTKLFSDAEIKKESQAIEIINTTSVTGLGARLARLITNMGGRVVQVSTEESLQKNSLILYNGRKTYTVKKLNKVLSFNTIKMGKQSIADITIVIGEDSQVPLSF